MPTMSSGAHRSAPAPVKLASPLGRSATHLVHDDAGADRCAPLLIVGMHGPDEPRKRAAAWRALLERAATRAGQ